MPWTEPSQRNLAFSWAWELIDELSRCGLSHIVCSPGSRSTPLTLAASAHPAIETSVVLDERSAAYIALGVGKADGKPAALICTSGTAAANYYPAVVEARQSGVPLITLTADRPPQLRNVGANQAIDQLKIFGNYTVYFHEAGEPVWQTEDVKRLRMAGDQAWRASIEQRGPAQINLAFRKPLEPEPDYPDILAARYQNESPPQTQWHLPDPPELPWNLQELIRDATRPIVVAGPEEQERSLAPEWVPILARYDVPILAEPGSSFEQHPQLADQLVRRYESMLRPTIPAELDRSDLVLRFGRQPVSKSLEIYLGSLDDIPHLHLAEPPNLHDATFNTTHRAFGKPRADETLFNQLDVDWLDAWKKHDRQNDFQLERVVNESEELTDGSVIQHGLKQLPASWNLMLSNSLPIRDAALYAKINSGVSTYVNRGASGIDGILSTAIGLTKASRRPGLVVIGDLAFLHDTNALLSASLLEQPLVALVVNNQGGSIFRMLPVHAHQKRFNTFFETPQQVDLSYLAKAYELTYRRIVSMEELRAWSPEDHKDAGLHLVECHTDADASMHQRRSLWN